jgi:phage/plasmid-like protein (TIGR03299 family)
MAHQILIDDGRAALFYVNEVPWHGLGRRLPAPPSSGDAITAAGLDWTVVKVPLYVAGGPRLHEVPHRFALVREDKLGRADCPIFGIAGRAYVPLQNDEAFAFFDPLVQSGDVEYETAGALRDGRRVWILGRLTGEIEVAGDTIQRYVLLSNSHDGRSSVQVLLTPIRVVCNNTLTLAIDRGTPIQVRHDADLNARLEQAKGLLRLVHAEYDEIATLFRRMSKIRLAEDRAIRYFAEVFPEGSTKESHRQSERLRRWARHFYRHGQGNRAPEVQETLWAAYNGVTELVDHARGSARAPDYSTTRLHSVWFGKGAATKQRALRVATEIVSEAVE